MRFHSIYWTIMLMALGQPLPKHIFGHPWMLFGAEKMSKSRGNVIYADDVVKRFGVDAVRYYLLSEMPYAQDGSITYESMIERFNADLANTIGNLVNRTIAMQHKYFDGVIQPAHNTETVDSELCTMAQETVKKVEALMDEFRIADALDAILSLARRSNKYIDETAPWVLAKDASLKERLGTVLYNLLESIRYLAVLLTPFMPDTAKAILTQLGTDANDYASLASFGALKAGDKVGTATPLFQRIDAAKLLEELEAEAPAPEAPKIELAPEIGIDEFFKTELRVAKVVSAEKVKKAKKLLCLQLDDGMGGRQVVSGIANWYAPEDLVGKKLILVANLKPVKLCGVDSFGMICAADVPSGDVKVIFVDDDIPCGTKIR